ncbi:hypothetical protein [Campylobacter concisus]|uniref:Uncharacterized protein n=1 Tax=Campylobacter concisus TaxID=199 RepID=A0A1Y5NFA9_9BACT|nr:hypothetical protein [Campylobacter concisus]OUT16512.1 hypothetical protein B9N61_09200 [Campylobacter concisus]QPI02249.1 hypothetical protein G5B95_00570 [Campylobacter concisus]
MLAGIDIARQNEEALTENEQTLNFIQADYRHLIFTKKWLIKFSKFMLTQPKFFFINLNYKQANFLANLYSY